jgi:hypothetical protein
MHEQGVGEHAEPGGEHPGRQEERSAREDLLERAQLLAVVAEDQALEQPPADGERDREDGESGREMAAHAGMLSVARAASRRGPHSP